jgi:hypothetical protein
MNAPLSKSITLIAALVVLLGVACSRTPALKPGEDAKAVAIADEVMQALGGKDAWDHLHGLRWTFEVSVNDTLHPGRRHAWDKMTGWQRVEGKSRTGTAFTFIGNLGSGEGHAWMDGNAIEGDSLQKLIKRSRSMWINDSYWFLMPYQLRDPGVTLKYDGDTLIAGTTFDRLALSFEKVGDTPGDHYWVFVNRANHRVERWDMVLQDDAPPARSYTWEGWEQHDGLWFPTAHRQENTVIYTRNIETVSKFGDKEFSAP